MQMRQIVGSRPREEGREKRRADLPVRCQARGRAWKRAPGPHECRSDDGFVPVSPGRHRP